MEAERRVEASEFGQRPAVSEHEDIKTAEKTNGGDRRVEPTKREQ